MLMNALAHIQFPVLSKAAMKVSVSQPVGKEIVPKLA